MGIKLLFMKISEAPRQYPNHHKPPPKPNPLYGEDRSNPINYYGYTKLKGEQIVMEHVKEWCIARPSVIYGCGPKHKQNFATWLINQLKQGKDAKILTDQHVSPTLNTNLAEMLIEIAEKKNHRNHTHSRSRESQ